ncbi:class I SAM-dependent methyltransferase [Henriciella litoralis]|uniref:class I SAM-dependent methyltransferase n=1 Tax=Henriciella litoralis TaxID=568102 RepID=UPI000A03BD08|nr:class I SAM-dependent methyltransferase [Henriciella litoralis]
MTPFDEDHAAIYDTQFGNMAPIRDCLNLTAMLALEPVPEDAHILCAGAGTGAEVLTLAATYPGWRFCLADPAPAMLAVARTKLEAAGILGRCTFHEGYLETLEEGEAYDGATSLLVSHFLTDASEREAYFREIAARLKPGALFVNADLAADRADPGFDQLMDIWIRGMNASQMSADQKSQYRENFGHAFAAHSPQDVAAMMTAVGFSDPVQIFQGMLIRSWVTVRT